MLNLSFIQPVVAIMFVLVFVIAIGYVVYGILCSIKDSIKYAGKKSSSQPYSKFDSSIFNNQSHEDFMRQSQFMHDQAHHQHIADAQRFMDHSVQVNNNFMNNMHNHMF